MHHVIGWRSEKIKVRRRHHKHNKAPANKHKPSQRMTDYHKHTPSTGKRSKLKWWTVYTQYQIIAMSNLISHRAKADHLLLLTHRMWKWKPHVWFLEGKWWFFLVMLVVSSQFPLFIATGVSSCSLKHSQMSCIALNSLTWANGIIDFN